VCRYTQPLTTLLFGDNLPQSLENIGKGNKIKNKLTVKTFGNNRGGSANRGFHRRRAPNQNSRIIRNAGYGRNFSSFNSQDSRPRTTVPMNSKNFKSMSNQTQK